MDKKFVLSYLSAKHLESNENLYELCEVVGIEVIRQIMESCESLQVRIPILSNNKQLLLDVIKSNRGMPERELRKKLGIPPERLRKYIQEISQE